MLIASTDVETTGFCEPEHRIVEVYIDLIDTAKESVIWSYEQRIDPQRTMPAQAQAVHHISMMDLSGQPTWETIGPKVHAILSKASLFVAHNAAFDFGFYNMEFKRIGLAPLKTPVLCTMENAIWAGSNGKKPSLKELCFAMDVPYDATLAHAAAYDVKRMNDCLMKGIKWGWFSLPNSVAIAA